MKKILLVDDSPTMLAMEQMLLAGSGFTLATAQNGQEALRRIKVEAPDLVIMDVVMPLLDGFETCKRLRESSATHGLPVILVTTRSEADQVQKGREAGCTDYVTKPIDGAELLRKVRDLLGEPGGA